MSGAEKLLPQNVEAEAGVLGSILIDPDAIASISQFLKPDDFYRPAHRQIYKAALDLYEAGTPADFITLCDEIERRGQLEDIGGTAAIGALANHVPTSRNVEHYARIVERCAVHRRLIDAAGKIAAIAYNDPDSAGALEAAERELATVRDRYAGGATQALPIMTDAEAEDLPPARGILGDVLYEDSVAFLYGPSGRWKSFIALAWALSIATGRPWLGRHANPGDVLYVASEGARGLGKRIRAWKRRNDVDGPTRLHVLGKAVDLTSFTQVQLLIKSVQESVGPTPALIVLDTLASSMSGDENGPEAAGAVIRSARSIVQALSCSVLIVHHDGKDSGKGMRGHSSLYSGADTVVRVSSGKEYGRRVEPGDPVTLVCDKPKESDPFRDITLTADVERWATDAGEIVSSLVIVPSDAATPAREDTPLTAKKQAILDALTAASSGLGFMEWQRASGASKSFFNDTVREFQDKGKVERDDAGIYTATPAGPVGPVRSIFGPVGPGVSGPVRSGVSIDTGLPDHASDHLANLPRRVRLADVEMRPGETIARYAARLEPLGFDSEQAAEMFYTPARMREMVEKRNRAEVTAS